MRNVFDIQRIGIVSSLAEEEIPWSRQNSELHDPYIDYVVLNLSPQLLNQKVGNNYHTPDVYGNVLEEYYKIPELQGGGYGVSMIGVSTYNGELIWYNNGDLLSIPDSPAFNLGSSDFFIEIDFWLSKYMYDVNIYDMYMFISKKLIDDADDATSFLTIEVGGGSSVTIQLKGTGSTVGFGLSAHNVVDRMNRLAIGRKGNVFYLFHDGVLQTSTTNNSFGSVLTNTKPFLLGNAHKDERPFNSYFSLLKITKGVCRHIVNYTPDLPPRITGRHEQMPVIHDERSIQESFFDGSNFMQPLVGAISRTTSRRALWTPKDIAYCCWVDFQSSCCVSTYEQYQDDIREIFGEFKSVYFDYDSPIYVSIRSLLCDNRLQYDAKKGVAKFGQNKSGVSSSYLVGANQFTSENFFVFIVASLKDHDVAGKKHILYCMTSGASDILQSAFVLYYENGSLFGSIYSTTISIPAIISSDSDVCFFGMARFGNTFKIFFNQTSSADTACSGYFYQAGYKHFYFGRYDYPAYGAIGDCYEVIFGFEELSSSIIEKIVGYFGHRYDKLDILIGTAYESLAPQSINATGPLVFEGSCYESGSIDFGDVLSTIPGAGKFSSADSYNTMNTNSFSVTNGWQIYTEEDKTVHFSTNGAFEHLPIGTRLKAGISAFVLLDSMETREILFKAEIFGENDDPENFSIYKEILRTQTTSGNVLSATTDIDSGAAISIVSVNGNTDFEGDTIIGSDGGEFTVYSNGDFYFTPIGYYPELIDDQVVVTGVNIVVTDGVDQYDSYIRVGVKTELDIYGWATWCGFEVRLVEGQPTFCPIVPGRTFSYSNGSLTAASPAGVHAFASGGWGTIAEHGVSKRRTELIVGGYCDVSLDFDVYFASYVGEGFFSGQFKIYIAPTYAEITISKPNYSSEYVAKFTFPELSIGKRYMFSVSIPAGKTGNAKSALYITCDGEQIGPYYNGSYYDYGSIPDYPVQANTYTDPMSLGLTSTSSYRTIYIHSMRATAIMRPYTFATEIPYQTFISADGLYSVPSRQFVCEKDHSISFNFLMPKYVDGPTINYQVFSVEGSEDNVGVEVFPLDGGSFVVNQDGSFLFKTNGDFSNLKYGETRIAKCFVYYRDQTILRFYTIEVVVMGYDYETYSPMLYDPELYFILDDNRATVSGSTVTQVRAISTGNDYANISTAKISLGALIDQFAIGGSFSFSHRIVNLLTREFTAFFAVMIPQNATSSSACIFRIRTTNDSYAISLYLKLYKDKINASVVSSVKTFSGDSNLTAPYSNQDGIYISIYAARRDALGYITFFNFGENIGSAVVPSPEYKFVTTEFSQGDAVIVPFTETVLVRDQLGDDCIRKISAYMAHKLGVSGGLSDNNPYKNAAPSGYAEPTGSAIIYGGPSTVEGNCIDVMYINVTQYVYNNRGFKVSLADIEGDAANIGVIKQIRGGAMYKLLSTGALYFDALYVGRYMPEGSDRVDTLTLRYSCEDPNCDDIFIPINFHYIRPASLPAADPYMDYVTFVFKTRGVAGHNVNTYAHAVGADSVTCTGNSTYHLYNYEIFKPDGAYEHTMANNVKCGYIFTMLESWTLDISIDAEIFKTSQTAFRLTCSNGWTVYIDNYSRDVSRTGIFMSCAGGSTSFYTAANSYCEGYTSISFDASLRQVYWYYNGSLYYTWNVPAASPDPALSELMGTFYMAYSGYYNIRLWGAKLTRGICRGNAIYDFPMVVYP